MDCHQDTHKTQFAAAPHQNRCDACHTVRGFRPSTFTLARHSEARFALADSHAAVPCAECHDPRPAGRFRYAELACASCHKDPHSGQFREFLARTAADGGCDACHSAAGWRILSRFDHSRTSFALAGVHRALACAECHRPAEPGGGVRAIVYRSAPAECAGCHEDIHGGQFATAAWRSDCGRCHDVLQWKPSLFDHDRDSDYELTGAHRQVRCALCHRTTREINGKLVLLYKQTPRECSGCHGPELRAE
jgi:hypothetical protein